MWQLYPYPRPCLDFVMWGRVLDIVNHAKFQLDQFRGFGAPRGGTSLSLDWTYRSYNSVRTNVLHHRRSQGVQWVQGAPAPPQGGENFFFRPNLQEKMCKCTPAGHEVHPPARARVNF